MSSFENTQVLSQLCSALEYLHNLNPPIGHRDIKPDNILVVERTVNDIYVKFADFGLSKAADTLKTLCGTLQWAAPEIYLKAADPVGAANSTYSVAIDIWSLGVVVASLECGGLPKYKQKLKTDAVAWIREVQSHVIEKYDEQGGDLLWLLIDSLLIEDPDERSSADYIHIEAQKLLRSMANQNLNDEDEGAATPKHSMLSAQSAVKPEDAEEASTFRPDIQSASRISIRETVEGLDSTDSEEEREQSGALGLLVPITSKALSRRSIEDDTSNRGSETIELSTDDAKSPNEEENNDVSFVRYQLGSEVQEDGAREVDEASEERQSMRKRSWPEQSSPLSLPRSFTNSLLVYQRVISKESSNHKRNKRDE